jgi:hypothetical protein
LFYVIAPRGCPIAKIIPIEIYFRRQSLQRFSYAETSYILSHLCNLQKIYQQSLFINLTQTAKAWKNGSFGSGAYYMKGTFT